jgi:hypothetical protein
MPVKAELGGKEFTFSPLTVSKLRQLNEVIKDVEAGKLNDGFDAILAMMPFIHASLAPAHSDITQEQLEQLLTVPDFKRAQELVMEASGMKVPKPGEAPPAAA